MREVVGFWIAATALLLGSVAVSAERDDVRACFGDARKYCSAHIGDRLAMRACMIENREKLSGECREALKARARASVPTPGSTTISYGADSRQALDYYPAKGRVASPLVIFVHGGGWSIGDKAHATGPKSAHFNGSGYAFASTNYRLVPDATVEQQAADVAAAVAKLRANAKLLGIDANRIALMGHSAGAHLVSLVATDPQYLKAAGVPMAAVKAVVLLDGAGYDVAKQMTGGGPLVNRMYGEAFGSDAARQARLSPLRHVAAPNAAAFAVLYDGDRDASRGQSEVLAEALRKAGSIATAVPVADTDHGKLNKNLGAPGDAATAKVDAFLKTRL